MVNNIYQLNLSNLDITVWRPLGGFGVEKHKRQMINDRGSTRPLYYKLHQHVLYEIFFLKGQMTVYTENDTYTYQDKIVIIPPWKYHCSDIGPEDMSLCLYFDVQCPKGKSSRFYDKVMELLNNRIVTLPISECMEYYFKSVKQCMQDHADNVRLPYLIKLLFLEWLVQMFPEEKLKLEEKSYRSDYRLILDNYMLGYLFEDINLEDMANELGLTPRRVTSLVKKYYDCTFTKLVNRKRLQAACVMLEKTAMTVEEIALASGYENKNYFYTCFRNEYHMNPQEYRKLLMEEGGIRQG